MRSAKDDLQNTSRIARHYYPWISLATTSPLRSAQAELQNSIAQHQREKVTWNPPLHCARKSSRIPRKATTPKPVAQSNLRFPQQTQCTVHFLTFKSHPSWSSSNAACQGWLALLLLLLYFALIYSTLLHSTLLYSSLLYSSLLYATLLFSALLFSTRHSSTSTSASTLLYSTSTLLFATLHSLTLFYFYSTLRNSTQRYSTPSYFYSTLRNSTQRYSTLLLYSTLLYFTLHGFTLLYSYFCLYSTCTKVLDCKEDSPAGNKHLLDNSPILTIISGDVGQWGRFPRMTRDFYAVLLRRDIRDCGCTAAWSRGLSIAKLHGIILNFESMRMCHMSLRCCTFL